MRSNLNTRMSAIACALLVNAWASAQSCAAQTDYAATLNYAKANRESNPERALTYLSRASKMMPQETAPWELSADIYRNQKQYRKAIEAITKAIAIAPDQANLYYERAKLWKTSLIPHKAVEDCNIAISKGRSKDKYYRLRAEVLTQIGKFDEALKDADKAISLNPREKDTRSAKADILIQTGKFEECVKECTAGLKINPKAVNLLTLRADAYERLDKKALAIDDYNRALKHEKISFRHLFKKGQMEYQLGRYKDAIASYSLAIERSSKSSNSRALVERAKAYEKLGMLKEAQNDRKAAQTFSDDLLRDFLPDK